MGVLRKYVCLGFWSPSGWPGRSKTKKISDILGPNKKYVSNFNQKQNFPPANKLCECDFMSLGENQLIALTYTHTCTNTHTHTHTHTYTVILIFTRDND